MGASSGQNARIRGTSVFITEAWSIAIRSTRLPGRAASKGEAVAWRDRLRGEIRTGTFVDPDAPPAVTEPAAAGLTLGDVIGAYVTRHVATPTRRKAALRAMTWNLDLIRRSEVPAANGATIRLEEKPVEDVRKADIEAFRATRRAILVAAQTTLEHARALEAQALTLTTRKVRAALRAEALTLRRSIASRPGTKGGEIGINRLLARLRHVFSWAIEEGYVTDTPFKRGAQTVVRLETKMETPRTRRLEPGEEDRLLAHAENHLRALIVAALTTGCRVGELLSLQWAQVRRDDHGAARWIVLPASKTKTNEPRTIPVGPRLKAELEMRRYGPDGKELAASAFVFGNEVGEPIASVKTAWRATCRRAGIHDLHFHDLRREFGSRLLESGASEHDVRDFLGHANITTTSRYLKSTPLRLEKALAHMEGGIRTPFAQTTDPAASGERDSLEAETQKTLIQ